MALRFWDAQRRKTSSQINPLALFTASGPPLRKHSIKKASTPLPMDVRRWPDSKMAAKFGDMGLHLARLARAEDNRPVKRVSLRKSVSAETTFNEDISDLDALKDKRKIWQERWWRLNLNLAHLSPSPAAVLCRNPYNSPMWYFAPVCRY